MTTLTFYPLKSSYGEHSTCIVGQMDRIGYEGALVGYSGLGKVPGTQRARQPKC